MHESPPSPASGPASPPEATTLPFRVLLDEAAKVSRRHVRTLFLPMALLLAGMKGISAVVQVVWLGDYLGKIEAGDLAGVLPSIAAMGCLGFVVGLITLFAYAVLWAAALDAVAGRPPSLTARLRWLVKAKVFGTIFLTAFCVLLGLIACVLPGFVVASILAFVVAVMVEEEEFGTAALDRSGRLAFFNPRRDFFATPAFKAFVLIFVATLLAYGLSMLIQLPVGLAQQFLILRDSVSDPGLATATGWLWLSIPAQVAAGFTSAAVQLYLAMGMALLYFDSRRRQDGWDLHAALDELRPIEGSPAEPGSVESPREPRP